MASNIVIVDTSFRRHVVKISPNQPLSTALDNVCTKLKLDSSNYGLKQVNTYLPSFRAHTDCRALSDTTTKS